MSEELPIYDRIPEIPGYKESHESLNQIDLCGYGNEKVFYNSFKEFKGDYKHYRICMDFLYKNNLLKDTYDNLLDIGGAPGIHAALLKNDGVVNNAEVYDVQRVKWKTAYFVISNLAVKVFYNRLKMGKWGVCPQYNSCLIPRNWPSPDSVQLGDFMEKEGGGYDLVTSFLCMEYFNYKDLFEKVKSLLNPGGVFFFLVNYWWYPLNSTRIVGGFPWACQRLTYDELIEYFYKKYPSEIDGVKEKWNYFHKGEQPVLNSYISEAEKRGLSLVSAERVIPQIETSPRTPYTPKLLKKMPEINIGEVLNDIGRFRDDVQRIDLETGWVMAAFKKETYS